MSDQWYFASGQKRFGPFSSAQLKECASQGRLQPTDTVWKEGIQKGVSAAKVKHLFPDVSAQDLPTKAIAPVNNEASTTIQPADSPSPLVPNEAAKLAPISTSTNAQEILGDQQTVRIPEGSVLTAVRDDNASDLLYSALPINSPVPAAMMEQPPETSPALTKDTDLYPKIPETTSQYHPSPEKKPVKKGRATGVRGVVIVSQDGERVNYRNKCVTCGYENTSRSSMLIRRGVTRTQFFCPKCRKLGEVAIQGII